MIPIHSGDKIIELDIPGKNLCFHLSQNDFPTPKNEEDEIRRTMENPVGFDRFCNDNQSDFSGVPFANCCIFNDVFN